MLATLFDEDIPSILNVGLSFVNYVMRGSKLQSPIGLGLFSKILLS